jgi:Protein of unknown function (DUF2971)
MNEKSIEEIEVTIAEASFATTHPELHHYTSFDGLAGIYQSNTIRATHFTKLNDSTEVILFREPLTPELEKRFDALIRAKQKQDRRVLFQVFRAGGIKYVSTNLAKGLASSLYQVTFEGGASFEFCDTYISSYCAHSDQPYESLNGLLSQWRGYGTGGGYCIVLDTAKLISMLAQEFDRWHYVRINIDSVHYAVDGEPPGNLFSELVNCCETILTEVLNGNMEPSATDAFLPFVRGATLYKHQGFREEREVRVVAMPGSQELQNRVNVESGETDSRPCKNVSVINDKGGKRSYISLFEGLTTELPIKRVIVGPSRNQEKNFELARTLLPKDLPVTKSATPFIG